MRNQNHRAITWLSAVSLAFSGLAFAASRGRLIGKVVDDKGRPLSGVTVTTTCSEIPDFRQIATTDGRGIFTVDFPRLEVVYLYQMEKAGHATLKVEQKWTVEETERHQFTLLPAQAPALDSLPPASTSPPAILAYNEGVRAMKAGDHERARVKFEEAAGLDPYMRQAWIALSAVHLNLRHYQQAVEAAEKAVALGSTDESVLRSRWEAYRQLGDQAKATKAREDLERIGRLGEEAKAVYNQGVRLAKAGDEENACAKFRAALELDPNFQPALLGLATSSLKLDRAAEAESAAETLLKSDPQHAEALKIRYNAALKLKDEAKLVASLLGLASIDAATARSGLFLLGTAAFDRDDMAQAKERFRHVLRIDPAHPRSHYSLGLILMREGAKAEAKSHLERFLALAPGDPDAPMARDALSYVK